MAQESTRLPPRWFVVAAWHVHRWIVRATGGRKALWPPRADKWGALRLTTRGRRSGEPRSVIVGYYEDGPNLVTMAMNGWGAAEPAWWLNLEAHPEAIVELAGGIRREVRGRVAEGADRKRLWQRWRDFDQRIDGFAARRPRETAVVILEPALRLDEQLGNGVTDRADAAEERRDYCRYVTGGHYIPCTSTTDGRCT